jgi:hypothetical protein
METQDLSEAEILELAASFEDPVTFADVYLGRKLWRKQAAIAHAVAKYPLVAVKACHGSGKTFLAAMLAIWWMMRYPDESLVLTTAPTWNQVEKLLWGEVREAVKYAQLKGLLALPKPTMTELRFSDKRFAIGISTNEGVRLQGFHNKHILIIVDEAPGMLPKIIEAIEGIRSAGHVHVLQLGNPVVPSGPFFDIFSDGNEKRRWKRFTIDAFDTPNFEPYRTLEALMAAGEAGAIDAAHYPAPYLITPNWVLDMLRKWSQGNPNWQSRVRGQFPEQSDMAIFPAKWVYAAQRDSSYLGKHGFDFDKAYADGLRIYIGIDVAGSGDDETAICVRIGPHIVELAAWSDPDPRAAVLEIVRKYEKWGIELITVDSNGVGYYFALDCIALGYTVRPANFGEAAIAYDRFTNLRAEMYWLLREWFEAGIVTGLTDMDAQGQLTGILYTEVNGRVHIESKRDARKRGMRSPDRAEAIVYAFADVLDQEHEEIVKEAETVGYRGVSRL